MLLEDGDQAVIVCAPNTQHSVYNTALPIVWTRVDTGAASCESAYLLRILQMAVISYKPEPGN